MEEETVEMEEDAILAKIPSITYLKDFFVNCGGYYIPPDRDLNSDFGIVIFMLIFSIILNRLYYKVERSS